MPMPTSSRKIRRGHEAGYSLLMVVFLVATMILVTTAVVPRVDWEGRREMEQEMVWRGEQYQRAISLYYQKFGRYPTKIEDLTRQTNGLRFLRQAYKDPMNKEDGSWRFIYVGPNGQLIGSVRQTSLLQSTLNLTAIGGGPAFGGGLAPLGAAPGQNTTGGTVTAGGTGAATGPGQQANGATTPNPLESQPQPLDGTVVGGNIIGVGSKIKKPSYRVYLGGDTYQKWEFIFNPTGTTAIPGQVPVNPNQNPTAPNGANNPSGQPNQQPPGQNQQQNPPGTGPSDQYPPAQ
jgi:hypothetical protein